MLDLPSNKILELKSYYYIPKIIRNIIFIPLLLKQGYEIRLMKNECSIFFSNKFYENMFVDNDLLFLSLSDNIFYLDNMKKERERI